MWGVGRCQFIHWWAILGTVASSLHLAQWCRQSGCLKTVLKSSMQEWTRSLVPQGFFHLEKDTCFAHKTMPLGSKSGEWNGLRNPPKGVRTSYVAHSRPDERAPEVTSWGGGELVPGTVLGVWNLRNWVQIWLCHFAAVWFWTTYVTSLVVSISISIKWGEVGLLLRMEVWGRVVWL